MEYFCGERREKRGERILHCADVLPQILALTFLTPHSSLFHSSLLSPLYFISHSSLLSPLSSLFLSSLISRCKGTANFSFRK